MSNIKNVSIIGSSSVLTLPIVNGLLNSNFNVTLLSRADSTVDKSKFPSSVNFKSVNYDSQSSIVEAFKGADAVISLLGFTGLALQPNLIDAAVEAGVKRFVPSEFGCDLQHPKARSLGVFAGKVATQEYLAKAHKESGLEYDLIITGIFWDMALINDQYDSRVIGISIPKKSASYLDGGNVTVSASTYPFIGAAVAATLSRPASNGSVKVANIQKTPRELVAILQSLSGEEGWEVSATRTSEAVLKESAELAAKGPEFGMASAVKQIQVGASGEGYGADFKTDNEALGLKKLSDEEIKEELKGALEKAGLLKA